MDTIFVKNVKERGPAHQAGLCTGKENVCFEREGREIVCVQEQPDLQWK